MEVQRFYVQNGKTSEHHTYTVNGHKHDTIIDKFRVDWLLGPRVELVIRRDVPRFLWANVGNDLTHATVNFFDAKYDHISFILQMDLVAGWYCSF